MPKVIVDPEELRRFATYLERWLATCRERRRTLEATRRDLESVWKDQRQAVFQRTYDPAMAQLDQFTKSAETFIRHLRDKAAKAERYLGRR